MSRRNSQAVKRQRRTDRERAGMHRPVAMPRAPLPRNGHQDVKRMLAGMLHTVPLEQTVTWLVMEANPSALADIAARAIALTDSVTSLYGVTDEELRYDLSGRICAAVAVDAMNADQLDDVSGAETERTLATINRELSQRVRVGGVA